MIASILKIPIKPQNMAQILEKIQKFIHTPYTFFHIVSLNPETLVRAQDDTEFRDILSEGDIQLIDGVGIIWGGSLLGIEVGERISGVDFMEILLKNMQIEGLRVLLLGGEADLADKLAICYEKKYPAISFKGLAGISDISQPKISEEQGIFSIVADYKPQILFVAFGSPWQEKWIYRHKRQLNGIVCMGVGGGFDFASGRIPRAPFWVRAMGLEWLFRLFKEPWRWRRQLRLIQFLYLIFMQRIGVYP